MPLNLVGIRTPDGANGLWRTKLIVVLDNGRCDSGVFVNTVECANCDAVVVVDVRDAQLMWIVWC